MKLSGKETFAASKKELWAILMDPNKLADIAPGLTRLDEVGERKYDAVAEVKIGPVKGSFKGEMQLNNINEFESFTMNVLQKSKIGNVDASVDINLKDIEEGKTAITFDGEAKMSGLLARTGSRVMKGVSNTLTNQFFDALRKELNN